MPALNSRGRGGRGARRLVNEINVVPYIDVMLVLLVIFMVTAPLLPPGSIKLPSAGKSEQKPTTYIDAKLEKGGRISLTPINAGKAAPLNAGFSDVVSKARQLGAGDEMPVVISADESLPYGEVVRLLGQLQSQNIRAALMVKPGK